MHVIDTIYLSKEKRDKAKLHTLNFVVPNVFQYLIFYSGGDIWHSHMGGPCSKDIYTKNMIFTTLDVKTCAVSRDSRWARLAPADGNEQQHAK